MTNLEKNKLKQEAQRAMRENGLKVFQKDMILLESGTHTEECYGCKILVVDYVMFTDGKSGKIYQCAYGPRYYNHEKNTLWSVEEYIA